MLVWKKITSWYCGRQTTICLAVLTCSAEVRTTVNLLIVYWNGGLYLSVTESQIQRHRNCTVVWHRNSTGNGFQLYFRLCPSISGRRPPPKSVIFLCLLVSLSMLLPDAPLRDLSNVLVFQPVLRPLSPLWRFSWPICCHSFSHVLMCPAHFHFVLWRSKLCLSLWFFA